jgi:hypothetical protein
MCHPHQLRVDIRHQAPDMKSLLYLHLTSVSSNTINADEQGQTIKHLRLAGRTARTHVS